MAQTKKKKSFANILSGGEKTVALDIGSRFVKLAILRRKKSGLEVKALDQMAIPYASSRGDITPEAVKETVRQLLARNRIKDVGVLSVMSRDFVTVSHLELPSTQREQIKQMLVFEAESHLPFAMERAITAFDFKPIEQPKTEAGGEEGESKEAEPVMSKVVFAAVRQALIPKFLELHTQKSLKQTAIQVSSFALYNLYDLLRREGKIQECDGDTLLIEMGAKRTEFILIGKDGDLLFTRNVDKGGDDLTSYLASEEGISFEEAESRKVGKWEETKLSDPAELLKAMEGLCGELDKTVRFLKNKGIGEGIKRVCLSGGSTARPEVCQVLTAPLGVEEPIYLDGLSVIQSKKDLYGPAYSAVLGAALAQVDEAACYIDLLPVDVVKLQVMAMRRKMLIKLAIGVVAAALLALLILGIAVFISNSKVKARDAELHEKIKKTKVVDALEKRNAQLQKAVNDIEGVISRKTSWNSVLAGISSCMTSNLWITSIGVDKNNVMTLEGYSRNADYLLFEENMQRQLRFENVIVPTEKTMYQYGLQVHYFKLTCDILPDYKYNEKLRGILGKDAESEKPASAPSPAKPVLEKKAEAPEEKEEIMRMEAPEQGQPFKITNPLGGTIKGSASASEEKQAPSADAPSKATTKAARSPRLMDKKKEAEKEAAAETAKDEAKTQEAEAEVAAEEIMKDTEKEDAETASAEKAEAVNEVDNDNADGGDDAESGEESAADDEDGDDEEESE